MMSTLYVYKIVPILIVSLKKVIIGFKQLKERKSIQPAPQTSQKRGRQGSQQQRSSSKDTGPKQARTASSETRQKQTRPQTAKQRKDSNSGTRKSSQEPTLRRPQSAKNLFSKQNELQSQAQTMLTSPSAALLHRDAINLPPKPTGSRAAASVYSSIGSHPLRQSSEATSSKYSGKSVNRRERSKTRTTPSTEQFSPSGSKTKIVKTLPSSGQKGRINSSSRRKQKVQSETLSPTVTRVKVAKQEEEVIIEEESEFARDDNQKLSFGEESEIGQQTLAANNSEEVSFKKHTQVLNQLKTSENYNNILQQIKSQMKKSLSKEEHRKKQKEINKEKHLKDTEVIRKQNYDKIKLQMKTKQEQQAISNKQFKEKMKQSLNECDERKKKKQEIREMREKERQERHEYFDILKDTIKLHTKRKQQTKPPRDQLEEIHFHEPPLSDRQHVHVKMPDDPMRISAGTSSKVANFIRIQKRERSIKRKKDQDQETKKEAKKELALKQLQTEYKKQMDKFKPKIIKAKNIKRANQFATLNSEQFNTYDGTQNNTAAQIGRKRRSKSRRRNCDDEKENRRVSVSPSKSKSEKKKTIKRKSKSKRRQPNEQLADLQSNVIEILSQTRGHKLKKAATMKSLDQFPPKIMPSQMFQSIRSSHDDEAAYNSIPLGKPFRPSGKQSNFIVINRPSDNSNLLASSQQTPVSMQHLSSSHNVRPWSAHVQIFDEIKEKSPQSSKKKKSQTHQTNSPVRSQEQSPNQTKHLGKSGGKKSSKKSKSRKSPSSSSRPKSAAVNQPTKRINLIDYVGPSLEELRQESAIIVQKYLRGWLIQKNINKISEKLKADKEIYDIGQKYKTKNKPMTPISSQGDDSLVRTVSDNTPQLNEKSPIDSTEIKQKYEKIAETFQKQEQKMKILHEKEEIIKDQIGNIPQRSSENTSHMKERLVTEEKKDFDSLSSLQRSESEQRSKNETVQQNLMKKFQKATKIKDDSWHFGGRSFQDAYEPSSARKAVLGDADFNSKIEGYEQMLFEKKDKVLIKKMKLDELRDKRNKSPSTVKQIERLEKWVEAGDQKIKEKSQKITKYKQGFEEMMSKLDSELNFTKKRVGTQKKSSPAIFNASFDWSHDTSFMTSSVSSTPRMTKPPEVQSSKGAAKDAKVFEYNQEAKKPDQRPDVPQTSQQTFEVKQKRVPVEAVISQVVAKEETKPEDIIVDTYSDRNSSQPIEMDDIMIEDISSRVREDFGDDESMSKHEAPDFLPPSAYFSALSAESSINDKQVVQISSLSPFSEDMGVSADKKGNISPNKSPYLQIDKKSPAKPQDLAKAFLDLVEPEEKPMTEEEANSMRDEHKFLQEFSDLEKEISEQVFVQLMMELEFQLFPKRPHIPGQSPIKDQESEIIPYQTAEPISEPEQIEIMSEHDLHQLAYEQARPTWGIQTGLKIVDQYLTQVFQKVEQNEDEFTENLSTPLNRDPLEILIHLQNAIIDPEMEAELQANIALQQSVLPVDLYLDIERNKKSLNLIDNVQEDSVDNKSVLAEWENIHNKVLFDAINEALDNFRPYGLRGPPLPWSQSTRTLTYKNGQQVEQVISQAKQKVMEWSRTFAGALPCSELLKEYGIRGPLDEDKLTMLREERLALVLASEIEENEVMWTDYEYEETQAKLDIADMILETLADEARDILKQIRSQEFRNTHDTYPKEQTQEQLLSAAAAQLLSSGMPNEGSRMAAFESTGLEGMNPRSPNRSF